MKSFKKMQVLDSVLTEEVVEDKNQKWNKDADRTVVIKCSIHHCIIYWVAPIRTMEWFT